MEERSPRGRTGLIVGKFLPPHRGHLALVEFAHARVEHLTVLVCSLRSEPIPGTLRYRWMRELCPAARVVHVTDENPSLPEESPHFWDLWERTIRRAVPEGVDVVFTSEDYGDELARRLAARHEPFDLHRLRVPISGAAIRRDPMKNWEALPDCVRPFFARRVVLIGSECTGKTTLAGALAAHYQTVWVPEFGRQYVAAKSAPVAFGDVEQIARGQMQSEDAIARQANRVLIQDTDLISTDVYSRHYFGDSPAWLPGEIGRRKADLYLLAGIDVPWEPDANQRDRGDRRDEMHELFRDALIRRGFPFVELSGPHERRLETAIGSIDAILDARPR